MCANEVTPKAVDLSPATLRLLKQAARVPAATDVPSPCVSVCRMSEDTQLCEGCWRTLNEIAAWAKMPASEKRVVWSQLVLRIQASAETSPSTRTAST